MVIQRLGAVLQRRKIGLHPVCFGIIEQCAGNFRLPIAEQMAAAVHIIHNILKIRVLRVFAGIIKIRRAVRIIRLRRKRMRHKIVDSAHQHMVGQVLHHLRTLTPAVRAENLTHGPALFGRVKMCQRGRQLCQIIIGKIIKHMLIADIARIAALGKPRHNLVQNNVDAGHIHRANRAEIMARPITGSGMTVVILNNMPDEHHAVLAAPLPHRPAVVLFKRTGNNIHIF